MTILESITYPYPELSFWDNLRLWELAAAQVHLVDGNQLEILQQVYAIQKGWA